MCGITKCTQNQGILRCSDCLHRPKCKRLKEFSDWDSFISHAPIFTNLDYLQLHGEAAFCAYIDKLIAESQYPPLVRKGTMNLKHLYRMMKGPFNPPK